MPIKKSHLERRPKSRVRSLATLKNTSQPNELARISVFPFDDYRLYLERLVTINRGWRGFKTRLAGAAGCTSGFLTQVMGGHASFSVDHMVKIAHFLGLSPNEWDYLRELVIAERCGSREARADSRRRIELMRVVSAGAGISTTPAVRYDAPELTLTCNTLLHWDVFHLLGAPKLGHPAKIAQRLKVATEVVERVLADWLRVGLVKRSAEGAWSCTSDWFTIHPDSIVFKTIGMMHRMRSLHRVVAGEIVGEQWTCVRVCGEDIVEIRRRQSDLLDFAMKTAHKRHLDGDRAVFVSLVLDEI